MFYFEALSKTRKNGVHTCLYEYSVFNPHTSIILYFQSKNKNIQYCFLH